MIHVNGLFKKIKKTEVLRDITFQVGQGEILGIGGQNGSGKSTLLRVLSALSRPTSGSASIAGYDVSKQPREVKRCVGYVGAEPIGYENLLVEEYLDFWASAHGLPKQVRATVVQDGIALAELEPFRRMPLGVLSKGIRQRVQLARAILHDPQVLVLDEPIQLLDTAGVIEWRGIIRELASLGKTVVLASAQLWHWFPICHHVAWLHEGRMVACDTLDALCGQYGMPYLTLVQFDSEEIEAQILEEIPGVLQIEPRLSGFQFSHSIEPGELLDLLMAQPWKLCEFRRDWEGMERWLASVLSSHVTKPGTVS